jgi:hypothetical protein
MTNPLPKCHRSGSLVWRAETEKQSFATHVKHVAVFTALFIMAATLAACGTTSKPKVPAKQRVAHAKPVRIVSAPAGSIATTAPQANGTAWVLAGTGSSKGIFNVDISSGKVVGSISVSNAARGIAESSTGLLGLAIGTANAGALEILNATTAAPVTTVALGAPAKFVVAGASGTSMFVLDGNSSSASVTNVDLQSHSVNGTVPVPLDTVAITVNPEQTSLFALQPNGLVSEISLAGGKVVSQFSIGHSGISLAIGPSGQTLYVLKGSAGVRNVAVIHLATDSVTSVLPAPAGCRQIVVTSGGRHLVDLVGTSRIGNLQIYRV